MPTPTIEELRQAWIAAQTDMLSKLSDLSSAEADVDTAFAVLMSALANNSGVSAAQTALLVAISTRAGARTAYATSLANAENALRALQNAIVAAVTG